MPESEPGVSGGGEASGERSVFSGSVREAELSEDSGILRAIFTEGFLLEEAGYVWINISRLGVSGSI